ncbi:MAG: hypothetical protein SNH79_07105 [Rikenellaceae bacterium]
MNKLIKAFFLMAAAVLLSSCDPNKADEEKKEYYLSQSRDAALCGWWKIESIDGNGKDWSQYANYSQDGVVYRSDYDSNGDLYFPSYEVFYWYADSQKIYEFYYTGSSSDSSFESSVYYRLDGDTLTVSPDSSFINTIVAVRSERPE